MKKSIQSAYDLLPAGVLEMLGKLYETHGRWADIETVAGGFKTLLKKNLGIPPGMMEVMRSSGEAAVSIAAMSEWAGSGPKIARPTPEQEESLGQISIDLTPADFSQPFPTVFVESKANKVFKGVLVWKYSDEIIVLNAISDQNLNDVTTLIKNDGRTIEQFLDKVDDDLTEIHSDLLAAQRLALNMCLALTNFGFSVAPAFPKALAEDEVLSKRDGETGEKAKRRVRYALSCVSFDGEVILRRASPRADSVPSGKKLAAHWVRGHWKTQPHGPKLLLRKRILIAPYLVHADEVVSPIGAAYVDRRN